MKIMEDTNIYWGENRRIRLKQWIDEHCDGKQSRFVSITNINQGELSRILLGKKSFGEKKARSLEIAAGMPNGWLDSESIDTPNEIYAVETSKLNRIPVYGKGMGGLPDRMFTDEGRPSNGHDEFADIYSADKSAFVVRVDGNSMYPKYVQGGYALVEPHTDIELEDDVIVKLKDGQVMLKRLVSKRGGVHLASYNDPEIFTFDESKIVWIYYVAYPVPSKKIKARI